MDDRYIVGLDIGSSKIKVAIASVSEDNEIKIIEANLNEKKSDAEKKYLEALKLFEGSKMTINSLSLKIENLENIIGCLLK